MKRKFLVYLSCLLVLCLLGCFYTCFIGEPVDGAQLDYTISETGQDMQIDIQAAAAGVALRDWRCRTKGNVLYISARKVPVSPFISQSSNHISLSSQDLQEIYLGGNLIWTAGR